MQGGGEKVVAEAGEGSRAGGAQGTARGRVAESRAVGRVGGGERVEQQRPEQGWEPGAEQDQEPGAEQAREAQLVQVQAVGTVSADTVIRTPTGTLTART